MDQQPKPLTDRIAAALSEAGAFCGECGFEPGETGCPDCVRVREVYAKELLAVVRPELDQRDAEIRRLRQHVEELQSKVMSSSNGQCCCSFDGPGDVCMVHSPTVDRLRAELAKYVGHEPTIAEEMAYLKGENDRLTTELRRETRVHNETCNERDRATDMADKLAAVIASEDVIGEHTGMNDPWQNALDHAAEKTYTAPGCGCQTRVHPGHYPSCTAPAAVSGA